MRHGNKAALAHLGERQTEVKTLVYLITNLEALCSIHRSRKKFFNFFFFKKKKVCVCALFYIYIQIRYDNKKKIEHKKK